MLGVIIQGEQIILRPYEKGDIFAWQKWDTNSIVQQYMPEPKNMSVSDEEQLTYLKECEEDKAGVYWTIVSKEDQTIIGTISLTDINQHHEVAELGVVIGEKEYWSKGVASESVRLVLGSARSELGLRRIIAEYEEGNAGMREVLEKNGFQQECVCVASRIKDGKPINTTRFYILLKE